MYFRRVKKMGRTKNIFSVPMPTTRNREHFPAYERSIEEQYLQTLLTNTMGNTFYASGNDLLQEANQLHDDILDVDATFAAKAMIFARNEGFMRLQPIFGLAKLSAVNPTLFAKTFPHVIKIPSDLSDFLTILKGQGRGEGGRAVKREVGKFMNNVSEYWALKYNGRGRGYSLGDIVATSHAKAKDERQNRMFRYLMGKETILDGLSQLVAFEALKRAETDSDRIHWITAGKLPHEAVTGAIKPTKAVWSAILEQMPIFALLRNLNTMDRAGVLDEHQDYISARLTDREALSKSKILPFRFLAAYNEVGKSWLKDVLRQSVEMTFDNLPHLEGRTVVFLDISGSMNGQYLRIGSVFALALYKKTQGQSLFWLFNTQAYDAQPSRVDSVL
jgi:60 kDa SS-A/Ro ribonucleoprotein